MIELSCSGSELIGLIAMLAGFTLLTAALLILRVAKSVVEHTRRMIDEMRE